MTTPGAEGGSVDRILDELRFGKYHLLVGVFIIVTMYVNNIATLSFVFTARDTQYRCRVPGCDPEGSDVPYQTSWLSNAIPMESSQLSKCMRYDTNIQRNETSVRNETCDKEVFNSSSQSACSEWIYGEGYSIVREFSLMCVSWMPPLVGTLNGAGQFVCLIYLGSLTDKYGRRNVMLVTGVLSGIVGFAQSFAPEFWSFAMLGFLNTAISSGNFSVAFIMGVELYSGKKRVFGTFFLYIFSNVGNILLGIAAWQIPYWRNLQRVMFAPAIILLLFAWIMPESIRWLIVKGHSSRAVEVIKRAARWNNVELTEESIRYLDYLESVESMDKMKSVVENQDSVPIASLLRSRRLSIRLITCAFCWIVNFFIYYGLTLNSVSLSSDPKNVYLNYVLSIVADTPGLLLYLYLPGRIGRRPSLVAGLLACGIASIAYAFVGQDHRTLTLVVFLIAKTLVALSFGLLHFYTSEMFPTTLRHSCVGCCSMLGRVGMMLAPQVVLLQKLSESLPMVLYGASALLAAAAALTFPETLNTVLPENIEDAEDIGMENINRNTSM